ncbi:hypothetical protein L6R52_08385 [Myxococcota bacterium]|nr:hypothetical protein [Myxococcota bacterium]
MAFLASCASRADVVEVPVDRAGSIIVATIPASGAPPELLALDVSAPGIVGVPSAELSAGARYVLSYDCRLSALELTEGRLAIAATPAEGRGLPAPASIAAAVDDRWERRDALPAELASSSLTHAPVERSSCTTFRRSSLPLPGTDRDFINGAVALDDRSALLVSRADRFFRATRDAVVELPDMSGLPSSAMFRDHDGRVWLLSRTGSTFVGHPDTGFVPGPPLAVTGPCLRAAVSPPGETFEAFVVTCGGAVQRFDGVAWSVLTPGGETELEAPSIAWAAPGEVYVAGIQLPKLVRFDRGTLVFEEIPLANTESINFVAVTQALGPIAGTRIGGIFRKFGGAWERVAALSNLQGLRVALPLAGGTLVGGGGGELLQYYDGEPPCPTSEVIGDDVWAAAALGDTLLVVVVGASGSVAVFLDREPPPEKRWPEACPVE